MADLKEALSGRVVVPDDKLAYVPIAAFAGLLLAGKDPADPKFDGDFPQHFAARLAALTDLDEATLLQSVVENAGQEEIEEALREAVAGCVNALAQFANALIAAPQSVWGGAEESWPPYRDALLRTEYAAAVLVLDAAGHDYRGAFFGRFPRPEADQGTRARPVLTVGATGPHVQEADRLLQALGF